MRRILLGLLVGAIGYCALAVLHFPANSQEKATAIKIVWTAAVVIPGYGPVIRDIPEPDEKFATQKECDAFGEKMVTRTEDWVRAALSAKWDFPVKVVWRCEAEGDPA